MQCSFKRFHSISSIPSHPLHPCLFVVFTITTLSLRRNGCFLNQWRRRRITFLSFPVFLFVLLAVLTIRYVAFIHWCIHYTLSDKAHTQTVLHFLIRKFLCVLSFRPLFSSCSIFKMKSSFDGWNFGTHHHEKRKRQRKICRWMLFCELYNEMP